MTSQISNEPLPALPDKTDVVAMHWPESAISSGIQADGLLVGSIAFSAALKGRRS
jgi:hypothetical protein